VSYICGYRRWIIPKQSLLSTETQDCHQITRLTIPMHPTIPILITLHLSKNSIRPTRGEIITQSQRHLTRSLQPKLSSKQSQRLQSSVRQPVREQESRQLEPRNQPITHLNTASQFSAISCTLNLCRIWNQPASPLKKFTLLQRTKRMRCMNKEASVVGSH
jgi:hypothetical protein